MKAKFITNENEVKKLHNLHDEEKLINWGIDILCLDMIGFYRKILLQNFAGLYEDLDNIQFLEQIGAIAKLDNNKFVPTAAGVLMFGTAHYIKAIFPNFFLDYREELHENSIEWNYRITSDSGLKYGTILEFYIRIFTRISNFDIIQKYKIADALKEVLSNALIHADYNGRRGIVIRKRGHSFEISNPGRLLISEKQLLRGGISDPRNPIIFKMFQEIGCGDRAGKGLSVIRDTWARNEWREPLVHIEDNPDRITINLYLS